LAVLDAGALQRGQDRPSAGEVLDLLAHGIEAHLAWLLRRVSLVVRQRVSLLALCSGALLCLVLLVLAEVPLPGTTAGLQAPSVPGGGVPGRLGPFTSVGAVGYVAWLAASTAYLAGRGGAARLVLGAGVVVESLLVALAPWVHLNRPPLFLLAVLAVFAVLAVAAPPPPSRAVRSSSAVVVLALGVVVVWLQGPWRTSGGRDERWAYYYLGGLVHLTALSPLVLVPALLVAIVASLTARPWLLASLTVLVPWAYLWMFSAWSSDMSSAVVPLAVLTALVLTATAALASATGFRVRIERTPR
jgi:hypothetical protein